MKRFFVIISTILALAACSNEGLIDSQETKNGPIKFGLLSTSRALVNNENDILKMRVSALMNIAPESNEYVTLFDNELVERDDSASPWMYENTRYWVENRAFHFFAVNPVADDAYFAQFVKLNDQYDGYRISFETPENADQDFLIAHKTESTLNGSTPSSVNFNFKHQLAKINFEIGYDTATNQNDDFYLDKITITNIKKKGTLSTSRFGDYTDNWSVDNTSLMSFIDAPDGGKEIDGIYTPWENGLRLIPQTIAVGSVGLRIEYRYKVYGGDTYESREINTSLPAITWLPGMQYTYKLTLHEDNYISFKAIDIQGWGSPQQGGAIIIK